MYPSSGLLPWQEPGMLNMRTRGVIPSSAILFLGCNRYASNEDPRAHSGVNSSDVTSNEKIKIVTNNWYTWRAHKNMSHICHKLVFATPNNDARNKNASLVVGKRSDLWAKKKVGDRIAYEGVIAFAILENIRKCCPSLLMSQTRLKLLVWRSSLSTRITVMTVHSKVPVDRGCKYFRVCMLGCFSVVHYTPDGS
jgi:hypothetical protein